MTARRWTFERAVPQDSMYDITMANLADDVIYIPETLEPIYPLWPPSPSNSSPITSPSLAAATSNFIFT